eukprot:TRINITY_DN6607_c0_g2_i1.p1 TRINITY_DN6607_c0_g2~~TRINITY_DN6607_c0_g2_i1.p1  ORF type:complete len:621 (+),score=110.51 TRINITY_DN6607_c0_g2_i1:54-1916(+)
MGRVQVRLIAARNLVLAFPNGFTIPSCTLRIGTSTPFHVGGSILLFGKKDPNPSWNKTIVLDVNDPLTEKLVIEVIDQDESFSQTIGSAEVHLSNLTRNLEVLSWYELQSKTMIVHAVGEIQIGLTALDFDSLPAPKQRPISNVPTVDDILNSDPQKSDSSSVSNGFKESMFNPAGPTTPSQTAENTEWKPIRFSAQDLQREHPYLAKGSYGVVYKGRARGINHQVVIKDMSIYIPNSVKEWEKEIRMMSRYNNPYVVKILGYCNDAKTLTIVMEYLPNGSLYDLLHVKKMTINILQRMRMARHCALGLVYIHDKGVIHRDVKSMNILVTQDYSCKYTDFGTAKLVHPNETFCLGYTANSGTPLWMAPEVKTGQYDFSADVYSLGLVFYELFETRLPHFDIETNSVVLPPNFWCARVVLPCINPDPSKRPKADKVVLFIDSLIRNSIENGLQHLTKEERITIFGKETLDDREKELKQLFSYLRNQPARKVDEIIFRASNDAKSQPSLPKPYVYHYPAQNPYGYSAPPPYSPSFPNQMYPASINYQHFNPARPTGVTAYQPPLTAPQSQIHRPFPNPPPYNPSAMYGNNTPMYESAPPRSFFPPKQWSNLSIIKRVTKLRS